MKYLLFIVAVFSSSCALYKQVADPSKFKESFPVKVDPYEAAKINEMERPITIEFSNPKTYADFSSAICKKISKEACEDKYLETAKARLKEQYQYADLHALATVCAAHPVECLKLDYLEVTMIQIHNWSVDQIRARDIAAERERSDRQTQAMFQGISNGLQKMEDNRLRQQEINRQNRPVNTYCQRNGPGISCQSN